MLDITIPERLKNRPLDSRGYPIPYIQYLPPAGQKVDFRVTDPTRRTECIYKRLCGICGEPLGYWLYLIGGEQTIKHRLFSDPPMHEECARFSMLACPFLNNPGYKVSDVLPKMPTMTDALQIAERPKRMGLYITRSYDAAQVKMGDGSIHPVLYCHPAKPKSIEWF